VIGAIAGSFAAAAAAIATSEHRLAWRFQRETLREYFGFSWPLFVNGLSGILVVQGAVITGNYTVGLAGLGAIALAQSFAIFADRVDDIIRRTIYPAVCAGREQTALLHEAFVKSNRLAVMWGLPFGVGLALFAPDLVTHVLGERWRSAGWLMQAFGLIIGFRQVGFNWTIFMRAVGWTKPIAVSMSSANPARSQPSKTGSSPAILEMSPPAKSMTPSVVIRMICGSLMPARSIGLNSTVILPPDASGMVSVQNGTSSPNEMIPVRIAMCSI
jgi:hypothetical protein